MLRIFLIIFTVLILFLRCEAEPESIPQEEPETKPDILIQEPSINESPEPVRYELTDAERDLVERVVMAEAGDQPYSGQKAVAQCLLNGCERSNIRPAEAVVAYQYAESRPEPTESVRAAVAAVFDRGEVVVDEVILWFYAPARVKGIPWHESQLFVCTIADHKFFAEKEIQNVW